MDNARALDRLDALFRTAGFATGVRDAHGKTLASSWWSEGFAHGMAAAEGGGAWVSARAVMRAPGERPAQEGYPVLLNLTIHGRVDTP